MSIKEPAVIVGREAEKEMLDIIIRSNESEFVVVYGRRRIGKTYLVREYLTQQTNVHSFMNVTGKKEGSKAEQLVLFHEAVEQTFHAGRRLPQPRNWQEAFRLYADSLEEAVKQAPKKLFVLFLDELPWLATPKGGLLEALEHIWNTRLVRFKNFKLIVCGSAASWMLEKIVQAKGGLHNRMTRQIKMLPFTIEETRDYLRYKKLKFDTHELIEIYMTFGGVPQYLRQLRADLSVAQNIGLLCFQDGGFMADEYKKLFASLFDDYEVHHAIIKALAKKTMGLTREEIIFETKLRSGGWLNEKLNELEEAGFIASYVPYGKKIKEANFRIVDEFVWFYFCWINQAAQKNFARDGIQYWVSRVTTPAYLAWAGYTFENLCLKHSHLLQRALKIDKMGVHTSSWRFVPARGAKQSGAQIDLLFDRSDGVINLCEIKYASKPFVISREYAKHLDEVKSIFKTQTRTSKKVHLSFITLNGLQENIYAKELVESHIAFAKLLK